MLSSIHDLLDRVDGDIDLAAETILNGPKKLARYVISVGLNTIKAKRRATRRRELRREIKPQFRAGKTLGSVEFTTKSKKYLLTQTQKLFGEDGWKIGNLMLGDFTRESLLIEADNETRSATGHLLNAQFYQALAEPLKAGQLVRDYWSPEDAKKLKDKIWEDAKKRKAALLDIYDI